MQVQDVFNRLDEHIEQDELNATNGFITEELASTFSDSVSLDALSNHSIHLKECTFSI
ncbi:hypothetical protein Syun_019103 [Stephania yunnanensis]|uniref:Uncharacterized protein n=1 Tax=Stephania yunnanensis TaxID=152371 RepID=A0AAP0IVU9_9MAGN